MSDKMTVQDFIGCLVDDALSVEPWSRSTFDRDFILVAEFSELEGPKPIMIIPDRPGWLGKFNTNSFAVRIMSVDCASGSHGNEPDQFTIAGDTQVVLTELSEGAVAYVHHFVLYDIRARGFVRPCCVAYVCSSYTELMRKYKTLRKLFSATALLFRFGNMLTFMNDLRCRFYNLNELKQALYHCGQSIYVDNTQLTEQQRSSISIDSVLDAIKNVVDISEKFHEYSQSDVFQEHRTVFKARFSEVTTKADFSSVSECHVDSRSCDYDVGSRGMTSSRVDASNISEESSVDSELEGNGVLLGLAARAVSIPADVLTCLLGKKYDRPLRHLSELCDVTYVTGVDILGFCVRHFQDVAPRTPCEHMGHAGVIHIGAWEFDIVGPLLNSILCSKQPLSDDLADATSLPPLHASSVEATSPPRGPGRDDTDAAGDHHDSHIPRAHSLSFSCLRHSSDDVGMQPRHSSGSFLSFLEYSDISMPASELQPVSSQARLTHLGSFVNIPYRRYDSNEDYIILDSPGSDRFSSETTSSGVNTAAGGSSSDSFHDAVDALPSCKPSGQDDSATDLDFSLPSRGQVLSPNLERQSSVVSSASTSSSLPTKIKEARMSLLSLIRRYSFLPHVVYSLLTGRPVIVMAEERNSTSLEKLVYGLANFVPNPSGSCADRVVPHLKGGFSLSNVGSVALAGLIKGKSPNLIPGSVKPYVTILDYEKRIAVGPPYAGSYLSEMLSPSKSFPSEDAYRDYVEQVLAELCSLAFLRFANLYCDQQTPGASSAKFVGREKGLPKVFDVRILDSNVLPGNLLPGDARIVEHLVRLVKAQLIDAVSSRLRSETTGFCSNSDLPQRIPAVSGIRLSTAKTSVFQGKKKR